MTPNDIVIPRQVRVVTYALFLLLGLLSGALHVGYSAAGLPDPQWLVVGSSVLAFVVSAPLIVALINVTPSGSAAAAERQGQVVDLTEGTGAGEPNRI